MILAFPIPYFLPVHCVASERTTVSWETAVRSDLLKWTIAVVKQGGREWVFYTETLV